MITRPRTSFVAFVAYIALLMVLVNLHLPTWLSILTVFSATGCVLLMLACLIDVFEQSEHNYNREFLHDQ